ncbi:MAG: XylR N-terminal domain-containing protein, partial [Sphingopyxis sp.]
MDEIKLIERFALRDKLRFQSEDGRIWFDQSRMLLLHAQSMGQLRRELIEQLGLPRARGIIWRMGFRSGQSDAKVAQKHAGQADDYDVFRIGPAMHMLEGMCQSDIMDARIDWQAATFEGSVEWTNSWEAESHIDLALPLDEADPTVCWSLTGYASGYVSEYFRRLVIFREHACCAAGGAKCALIGKAADAWDDASLVEQLWSEPGDDGWLEAQAELQQLRLQTPAQPHHPPTAADAADRAIIGTSPAFSKAFSLLGKASNSLISVLLQGETGVGKEVFARWLHEHSPYASGPFIAVNCAAIPLELIEAELFGVRRGAYTGAEETRAGRFERADGGTL